MALEIDDDVKIDIPGDTLDDLIKEDIVNEEDSRKVIKEDQLDEKKLSELLEKLKAMTPEQKNQLLKNMPNINNDDRTYAPMSEENFHKMKRMQFKQKLQEMRMKRMSRTARNNLMEKMEQRQNKDKPVEPIPPVDKSDEVTKNTLKNRKKREKKKIRLLAQKIAQKDNNEHNNNDHEQHDNEHEQHDNDNDNEQHDNCTHEHN